MEQTFMAGIWTVVHGLKAAKSIVVAYIIAISAYTTVIFGSELIGHSVLSSDWLHQCSFSFDSRCICHCSGMAAYTQYEMQKNTNLIEAAKNELEKAYAPYL